MAKYTYPCGLSVGDKVELIPGPRKYNTHIQLSVGDTGRVLDPPNEGFPDDAVQVQIGTGIGALDACILRKVVSGQTELK